MRCTAYYNDARRVAAVLAALSAAALAGAYFFQYVVGLAPCPLCLYQRIPHAMIVLCGLAALMFACKGHEKKAACVILVIALIALGESGLAFYHAGVEQHWWSSFLEACTATIGDTGSLLQQIEQTAAVRCDSVPWSLFGISMAGYNAMLSAVMFVYALAASVLITRRANGL